MVTLIRVLLLCSSLPSLTPPFISGGGGGNGIRIKQEPLHDEEHQEYDCPMQFIDVDLGNTNNTPQCNGDSVDINKHNGSIKVPSKFQFIKVSQETFKLLSDKPSINAIDLKNSEDPIQLDELCGAAYETELLQDILTPRTKKLKSNFKSYLCPFCDKRFTNRQSRSRHVHMKHVDEMQGKCDVCGHVYTNLQTRCVHTKIRSRKILDSEDEATVRPMVSIHSSELLAELDASSP